MNSSLHHQLERHAKELRDEPITLGALAELHGASLPGSLLVMMAVPCVLPVPGVGNVLGVAMMLMALAMWRGDAWTALPARVSRLQLSAPMARRLLRLLGRVYRLAERCARQRWSGLAELRPRTWLAPTLALMGGVIFLPLPFGNVLPAIAVAVLGVGVACRDGIAVLSAAALALVSLAYAVAVGAATWTWLIAPLAG